MTGPTEPIAVRLPDEALTRLDGLAAVEGGTRADVARRLLLDALADLDTAATTRGEQYSLLDVDEDLAGP